MFSDQMDPLLIGHFTEVVWHSKLFIQHFPVATVGYSQWYTGHKAIWDKSWWAHRPLKMRFLGVFTSPLCVPDFWGAPLYSHCQEGETKVAACLHTQTHTQHVRKRRRHMQSHTTDSHINNHSLSHSITWKACIVGMSCCNRLLLFTQTQSPDCTAH